MFIGPYHMIDILKKKCIKKKSFRRCKINLIYDFTNVQSFALLF